MEFLFGLLVGLSGLGFWWLAFIALFVLAEVISVYNESTPSCSLFLGVFIAAVFAFNWLGGNPLLSPLLFCWEHISCFLVGFPLYFLFGGLWSLFKWYQYLLKVRDELRISVSHWEKHPSGHKPTRQPRSYASNNKGRIMGWIAYWPFSVLAYLFGDFLSSVVRSVYRSLSKVYDGMGNRIFKGFE